MKHFEEPRFEVLTFAVEDIMTMSSNPGDGGIELPDHEW